MVWLLFIIEFIKLHPTPRSIKYAEVIVNNAIKCINWVKITWYGPLSSDVQQNLKPAN